MNYLNLQNRSFDFQGHRGCRGLMPENTITGFLKALDLGVTTLEMDVVISKDHQVLCSHEPWFSHEISQDPNGHIFAEAEERNHSIYKMTFAETQKYDVGLKPHPRFPNQENIPATKPLLAEVIVESDKYALKQHRALPFYNIETKCLPLSDDIFHPTPEVFSDLLLGVIFKTGISDRAIVQSFDIRTLQYIRKNHPEIKLALLVENNLSAAENLKYLGFTPDIYSPDSILVSDNLIAFCRSKNMKIIPWTLNELREMKNLISMGVDGLISDFPNKYLSL